MKLSHEPAHRMVLRYVASGAVRAACEYRRTGCEKLSFVARGDWPHIDNSDEAGTEPDALCRSVAK